MRGVALLIFISFSGLIQADVAQQIDRLERSSASRNGPNCWNSVLFIHQFVSELTYSSEQQLDFWLKSPFCRKIKDPDEMKFGDVIVIRDRSNIIHAQTWIDKDWVFSKNTSHKEDPYSRQSMSLLFQMFRVDEEFCRSQSLLNPLDCGRWAEYYRCQTAEDQRSQFSIKNPTYIKLKAEVEILYQQIDLNLQHGNRSHLLKEDFKRQIRNLERQIPATEFFYQALEWELDSLLVTVDRL